MSRGQLTPYRKTQAKHVLEGIVRWLAPAMLSPSALREAVTELSRNNELWAEIEAAYAAEDFDQAREADPQSEAGHA